MDRNRDGALPAPADLEGGDGPGRAPGQAVLRFSRYHKYTLGSELRQTAQRLCRLVARANDAHGERRAAALDELVLAVEEMKTLLTLAQETKAFANFNEFAVAAELAVGLGKQSPNLFATRRGVS